MRETRAFGMSLWALVLVLFWVPEIAHAANVTVNCPTGSINAAIASLPATGPNTITVNGMCTENVILANESGLTIVAGPGGAQIIGPQDSDVIDISSSQGINLQNLEIVGVPGSTSGSGGTGVFITEASDVQIIGCNIHNNQATGVSVDMGSVLFLRNSMIQNNNPSDGLDVLRSSSANIKGTTIQNNGSPGVLGGFNNGGIGVFVAQNASVLFGSNNVIRNNADIGIWARLLSTVAFKSPSTIEGHNISGIYVDQGGHLQVNAPILVEGNGSQCSQAPCGGIIGLANATLELVGGTVTDNQGAGISVGQGTNVHLAGATVSNNSGDGVDVRLISIADFTPFSGPGSVNNTIVGNGGASIRCDARSLAVGDLSSFAKVRCQDNPQR